VVCQEQFVTETVETQDRKARWCKVKVETASYFAAAAVRKTAPSQQWSSRLNDKCILTQVDFLEQEELHRSETYFSLK